jgi:hypothetical protein
MESRLGGTDFVRGASVQKSATPAKAGERSFGTFILIVKADRLVRSQFKIYLISWLKNSVLFH